MRVYLVAPVPLGALVIGWAVGCSLGVLILIAACLSLGFGAGFWWCWDALQTKRGEQLGRSLFHKRPISGDKMDP